MIQDDEPIGKLLSRRDALALLGISAAALYARGLHAATCVVRPQQTAGPFFVDKSLHRSDIRLEKRGAPLAVTLSISRLRGDNCEPLRDAQVDLWQCDAAGYYSGVNDSQTFLRGYQKTDARGAVRFVTIYPGHYPGRPVHIHFKVRSPGHEFTSQLYFDDKLTDAVHANASYAGNRAQRTRNQDDWIYRRGGDQLTLEVTKSADLLEASFAMAMQY